MRWRSLPISPLQLPHSHLMRIHLHDRASVALPCEDDIVQGREHRNATGDYNSPVHHLRCWVYLRRPEAEEDDEQQVTDCNRVVGNTKRTLQTPWSPC